MKWATIPIWEEVLMKRQGQHLNHHAAGRKVYSGVKRVKGADLPRYLKDGKIVVGKKHTPSVGSK